MPAAPQRLPNRRVPALAFLLILIALAACDAERGGVSAPSLRWPTEVAAVRASHTLTCTTAPTAIASPTAGSSATSSPAPQASTTSTDSPALTRTRPATETPTATGSATSTPAPTATPRPTGTATGTALAPPGAHHSGQATYYKATGGGACSFDETPQDLMVAALNEVYYGEAELCGAYVQVTGPKGVVVVRIVDLCPGCLAAGLDLDLSQQAFEAIADLDKGRVGVTWRVVSPEVSGPLGYHFADGSSRWWTGIQIRNHRNPVARLEYRDADGHWVSVPRKSWNYFVQTEPGMGPGPYELRVTDAYGNQVVDTGIVLTPGGTVTGSAQFPAASGQ